MVDLYRVRTNLVGGSGSDQVSTMFFSSAASETAQDAATAVRTFWYDMRGKVTSAYTATVEPEVFLIDQATGEPTGIESTTTTPVSFTDGTDKLPWVVQGLVQWTTGTFIGGRQVRGRTYIPGVTGAGNTNGIPNSDYLTALNTAAATLLGTTGVTLVVYSRKNHSAWPVVSRNAWQKWAELRSRRD